MRTIGKFTITIIILALMFFTGVNTVINIKSGDFKKAFDKVAVEQVNNDINNNDTVEDTKTEKNTVQE